MNGNKGMKNALVIGILLAVSAACVFASISSPRKTGPEPLAQYWSSDAEAAQSLREYVTMVTDPKDTDNFIPEKDRIAVFDMDGTLACETYYTYYDTMMFIEYCLHDHPERVSDDLKRVAAAIQPGYTADENQGKGIHSEFHEK